MIFFFLVQFMKKNRSVEVVGYPPRVLWEHPSFSLFTTKAWSPCGPAEEHMVQQGQCLPPPAPFLPPPFLCAPQCKALWS